MYRIKLSQLSLSLLYALYIGCVLNGFTLVRHVSVNTALEWGLVGLAALAMSAFSFVLLFFFAALGAVSYRLLISGLLLICAGASYYMSFYNVVVGYGVVISVLTTDTDLSRESLGYKFGLWMLLTAALPIVALYLVRLRDDFYARIKLPRQGWICLLYLILALMLCVLPLKIIDSVKTKEANSHNAYSASVAGVVAHSYLPTNWLAGLGLYFYQQFALLRDDVKLLNPTNIFSYAEQADMSDSYVVFIIGETTRSDHMGLLGYGRDTTPQLAQEKNLVALSGRSCDTATKLSLRCMFVREGGAANDTQRTLRERNVFAVLKDLGFSSQLFSMQSEVWFYNSIAADSYEIREVLASSYGQEDKPLDDMLLVDALQQSLAQHSKGKHLVVLHTKGSHYLYSQRHPANFAKFKPECLGIDAACSKAQLINSFDNSVLYVDHMIKRTIDSLRDKNALVFYVADHGESISDNMHFHATPRDIAPDEQFRVPFMVWASDSFLSDPVRQAGFAQLQKIQASKRQLRHEEIYDSVLGCLGFASSDGGINAANNWCAPPIAELPAG